MDNEKQSIKEKKEQAAIVAQNIQVNGNGLVLRNLADMKLAAETFINSNLVPSHFDSGAKVIVALQAGAELGFKPWQSLNQLHVVSGRVGISSTAIGGLIRSSGKCKYMKQHYKGKEGTDEFAAIVESKRIDDPTTHTTIFSVADAKTAQLWGKGKDNWTKYPKEMLMWRALSKHGRAFYGDVLCGFYTAEELSEIHPPDEQAMPHVPGREERKQVEEVTITDTAQLTKDKLNELIDKFLKKLELACAVQLYPDQDGVLIVKALALFASKAVGDNKDYTKPETFDLDTIQYLSEFLDSGQALPEELLEILPEPFTEKKNEKQMTLDEVDKHSKEKFGDENE